MQIYITLQVYTKMCSLLQSSIRDKSGKQKQQEKHFQNADCHRELQNSKEQAEEHR